MSMIYQLENERRAAQQAANQQAYSASMNQANQQQWDRGREMHERGLQQQEQRRRQMDSDTARQLGSRQYDVKEKMASQMGGVLSGLSSGPMSGFGANWPYGQSGRTVTMGGKGGRRL